MIKFLPIDARCTIMALITGLGAALLITGCSTTGSTQRVADIAGTLPAHVPIDDLPFSFLHQQLIGSFGGDPSAGNRQIQVLVERQGNALQFVALGSAGLQLYKLNYNGNQLEATRSLLLPETFSPWRIVSDFMATYASKTTLSSAISEAGWAVQETVAADGWQRIIKNAEGEAVITVSCGGNTAESCYRGAAVQNLQLNYGLTVNTLAYEHNNNTQQGGGLQRATQGEHTAPRPNALGGVGRIARRPLQSASQR